MFKEFLMISREHMNKNLFYNTVKIILFEVKI